MKQFVINHRITNRESESFNLYLKDISEIDILTVEQERELLKRISNGDEKAKNELIERNLRFVISVAKQYATGESLISDLVNEGNIGLIIAANKFDPKAEIKLISYAVWGVRKNIMDYLMNNNKIIRLPANKHNSLSKLDNKISELEQILGRPVDINEISDYYGNDFITDDMNDMMALKNIDVDSLNKTIGGSESDMCLSDVITDNMFKSTDHLMDDTDIKSEINRILSKFSDRNKKIIVCLFGLDGRPEMTLKEVSDEMSISREMVRQIKNKCLDKLKVSLANSDIRQYL